MDQPRGCLLPVTPSTPNLLCLPHALELHGLDIHSAWGSWLLPVGSRGRGTRCAHRGVTAATQGRGSRAPEQGSQGGTGLRVEAGRCPGHGSSLKSHQVPAGGQAANCGPQGGGTAPSPRRGGPGRRVVPAAQPQCLVLRPLTSLTPGWRPAGRRRPSHSAGLRQFMQERARGPPGQQPGPSL